MITSSCDSLSQRRLGLMAATLLLCCLLTSSPAAALGRAWTPFRLTGLQQTEMKSAAGAVYRIIVASPAGAAPPGGYPVIYVVDGNAWTGLVSELIRANLDVGVQSRVEPAVVVGIGYPTNKAFDLVRRKLDFTSPVPSGRREPLIGDGPVGGDQALMDFIEAKVKPMIANRFDINRSRQSLVGASLGGLFTLEMLFDRPGAFQTYVALSPSIWWNHAALLDRVGELSGETGRLSKLRVFISVGSLEQTPPDRYVLRYRAVARLSGETQAEADADLAENESKAMVENARRMATRLQDAHVLTRFVEFPDEDHFSVVAPALGRAIPFALEDDVALP